MAEAGIHVQDFSRDRRGKVGEQERGHVAHLVGGHIAPQRGVLLDELQDLPESDTPIEPCPE